MVKKILVVGDPHLKINAVKEAENFINKLLAVIQQDRFQEIVILGDLFDTFAVIRSEIMALWSNFFKESASISKITLIVGNHDMAGENGGPHSLEPFKNFMNIQVIDKPVFDGVAYYLPFYRDNNKFIEECRGIPHNSILFCHQSFNGAQFENGFYDPNGVQPEAVSHLSGVISGHIHKNQKLNNIWYPGTPYQMSFSDSGEIKGIYEIELTVSGYNVIRQIDINTAYFFVLEANSISELIEIVDQAVKLDLDFPNSSFKMKASGDLAEIESFWKNESVKSLKSKSKRVVDALLSTKSEIFIQGTSSKNKREKLHEFIKSRKWRTPPEKLINLAEVLITQ